MAKKAVLTYDYDWYAPVHIRNLIKSGDKAAVRKEYTRLRDISQKRLKRMAKTDFTRTQIFKKNINHYPKLKDIQSDIELASRLSDLSRFVKTSMSTVSGQEKYIKKSLITLHKNSYTFVNRENFFDFADFMEEYRAQALDMIYDSGEATDVFEEMVVKRKMDPLDVEADFEYWLENREELKKMRNLKKEWGKPVELKARLEKRKAKGAKSK